MKINRAFAILLSCFTMHIFSMEQASQKMIQEKMNNHWLALGEDDHSKNGSDLAEREMELKFLYPEKWFINNCFAEEYDLIVPDSCKEPLLERVSLRKKQKQLTQIAYYHVFRNLFSK